MNRKLKYEVFEFISILLTLFKKVLELVQCLGFP